MPVMLAQIKKKLLSFEEILLKYIQFGDKITVNFCRKFEQYGLLRLINHIKTLSIA